jgi:hypothetical protein
MDTLSDTYNNYLKTSIIKPPISKFELIYDLIKNDSNKLKDFKNLINKRTSEKNEITKKIITEIEDFYNKENIINKKFDELYNKFKSSEFFIKTEYDDFCFYYELITNKDPDLDVYCKRQKIKNIIDKIKLFIGIKEEVIDKEQYVFFKVNPLDYKSSLNIHGPRKYGKLKDLLANNKGEKSTVGTNHGRQLLPEIRDSVHYKSNIIFNLDEKFVEDQIKKIVPKENYPYIKWFSSDHKYDVIEYLKDCFFEEHTDRRIDKLHFATLLIFPPAIDELAHTGGDLIIDDFIFESSKNKEWIFIAFKTGLKHQIKKVLSGRRIVIKTELKYSSKLALVEDFEEDYDFDYEDESYD